MRDWWPFMLIALNVGYSIVYWGIVMLAHGKRTPTDNEFIDLLCLHTFTLCIADIFMLALVIG